MIRPAVHILLHFLVPLLIAWYFYREKWLRAWLIMLSALLIDLDHLLADPVYAPGRCSIGFHPLHSYVAIALYPLLLLHRHTRLFGIGLMVHIGLDAMDCIWMRYQ